MSCPIAAVSDSPADAVRPPSLASFGRGLYLLSSRRSSKWVVALMSMVRVRARARFGLAIAAALISVLSGCGGSSTDAPPAQASVAPSFATAPANQSVTEPAAASWSVTVNGTPTPALQWQQSTDAGITWTDIPGATAATYTLPTTTAPADDGRRYRVVATSSAGSTTSTVATLAVAAAAPLPGGADVFTAAAAPQIAVPTLDPAYRASALVTPAGGTLVLDGAAGVRYTLTVPAGALVVPTVLSMTVLSGVSGDGFERFVAGVQLEPAGLQLLDVSTLEITGIAAPPADRRIHAGIDGPIDGELFLNLFDNTTDAVRLKLSHFSSAYVAEGSLARQAALIRSFTTASENRLSSVLAATLALQPRGSVTPASALATIRRRYQDDVIRFQTASGPASCAVGYAAIASAFSATRQLVLLGDPANDITLPPDYLDRTINQCIAEANCSLVKRLSLQRQVQLLGASPAQLARLDAEEARCSAAWSGQVQWRLSGTLHRTEGACAIDETRQGSGYVEYNSTGRPLAPTGGVLPGVNLNATEASRYTKVCSYDAIPGDPADCYLSKSEQIITEQGRTKDVAAQFIPQDALVTITGEVYTFLPSSVLVPVTRVNERWETTVCRSNNNVPVRTLQSRIVDADVNGPSWDNNLGGPWAADQTDVAGTRTGSPQSGGVDLGFSTTLQQDWAFKRP